MLEIRQLGRVVMALVSGSPEVYIFAEYTSSKEVYPPIPYALELDDNIS
jgi:hypothetical protein